jgi:hypothetical protein
MVRFETTPLRVKRSPEEVFAYVADVNRHDEWSSAVQESRLEGFGPVAKGSRYYQKFKILGRTVEGQAVIEDYEPGRRVAFRSLTGPMPYGWDVVVEPADGGTVLTSHGEMDAAGLLKLAAPAMRSAFKRQAEHDFRALKTILEAEV